MGANEAEYTPSTTSQSNVNIQQLVNQEFLSTIFGVPGEVGYGGQYGLQAGILPGGVTFSGGDLRNPSYDPNAARGPVVSVNDALAQLHGLPKDEMINWKNKLYDAGLYDPSMYSKGLKPRQVGVMTPEDTEAFRSLLLTSARAPAGTTTQQVLDSLQKDSPFSAANNHGRQPYQSSATTSDPATIRRYAQTAAQELIGRNLTDAEEAKLVGRLVSQENQGVTAGANAAANLQASGQGGVVITQNVDVNARAQEAIEADHAAEAEAKKFANGYDVLMKMIGAGS